MEAQFPGMDYDFLRYMGVLPENQRRIQSHYTPYFEQCSRVVDLACGDADFVEMMVERGIDVVGVDSDDKAYAATAAKGLPVVMQDVFAWLAAQPDASVDGVFSAHLIEHLPYPKVIELIEQSYRILQPGGVILLVTPNVRSLFSHLEMFYTHFGHITFYHPRLVSFFLDRTGFINLHSDENPITASPLLSEIRRFQGNPPAGEGNEQASIPNIPPAGSEEWKAEKPVPLAPPAISDQKREIPYQNEVPLQGRTPLHYLNFWVKRFLTRSLVRPLTDSLVSNVQKHIQEIEHKHQGELEQLYRHQQQTQQHLIDAQRALYQQDAEIHGLLKQLHTLIQQEQGDRNQQLQIFAADLQKLNGAFEAFVWAYKPEKTTELEPNEEQA